MSQSKSTTSTFVFTPAADLAISFVVGFTFSFIGAALEAVALLIWSARIQEPAIRAARRDHAIAASGLSVFGAVLPLAIIFFWANSPFQTFTPSGLISLLLSS
jgi:uncharacterized membrane protein